MKKIFFTLIAFMATLVASAQITEIYEYNDKGELKSEPTHVFNKKVKIVIKEDPHDYVDLGLPSGTLWATCNVGASKPEEWGDHFAWGETTPKPKNGDYFWDTYKWSDGGVDDCSTIYKYTIADRQKKNGWGKLNKWYNGDTFVGDGKEELDPEDDAATVNWGNKWCMPTYDQLRELTNRDYTTYEWTTLNGVKGCKITSKKNGNSIFLPATGYRYHYDAGFPSGTLMDPHKGFVPGGAYWSRSLTRGRTDIACYMYADSGYFDWNYLERYYGCSVRPVRVQNQK